MKKQIPIEQLRPGMYLTGMDQSWWKTPFILHHRLIKSEDEIFKLRQAGVKRVEIDPSKGLDVESSSYSEVNAAGWLRDEIIPAHDEQSTFEPHPVNSGIPLSFYSRPEAPVSGGHSSTVDQLLRGNVNEEAQAEIVREAAIQAVEKIFEGVVTGVPIDYPLLQKTAKMVVCHITTHARSMSQLVLLQNLRAFDKHLYGHVVDVCALSVVIGIELGWAEDQLHELAIGGLLHDIGYTRLPANLLRQRQSGLETDSALLSQHAELGAFLLKQSPDISPSIWKLVQEHHERMDGSGFPAGLKGTEISAGSHLIGLIDCFDSMTSHWGVNPQKSSAHVLRELYAEATAGQFDVHAVEMMIRCLGIYPVGSLVELSTKERGLVTMINPEDLLKPVIKVISDEQGRLYPSPFLVDLADSDGQTSRTIAVLLDPSDEGVQVGKYFPLAAVPA